MILQPVLNVFLLLLLFAPVAALAVIALVKNPTARALWAMRIVMLAAVFVMLLRPGIPGGATQTLATDTDIVLVVDTTASIVAEDWADGQPRLDGVREDVQRIVEEYPGARFALITFAASADLRMPLTTDTTSLISSLEVLRPEVTSQSRGSSIGIAASLLRETLSNAAENSDDRSRMVFYFGDGEQTVSSAPEPFDGSADLTDAGAVFGYGTAEGGPMKLNTGGVDGADGGYIEYQGSNAMSVIDEQNLETIAQQLGVEYQHRTADAEPDLPAAPTTTVGYSESGSVGNVIELYWIAALVVIALLAVELARASMLIARLRHLRAPRPRSYTSGSSASGPLSERSETKRPSGPLSERPTPGPLSERSETKRATPRATPPDSPRPLSERSETKRPTPRTTPPAGGVS